MNHIYHTALSKGPKITGEEGAKGVEGLGVVGDYKDQCFLDNRVVVILTACVRPVQSQARPNIGVGIQVGHRIPFPAMELLVIISCWKR